LLQGAAAQLAQLTLLSRTAALAILEAALKQMQVCALLHNDVNHLSHSPACFLCWPHQPELHVAFFLNFLLLAACVLVVPAAGWCLPVLAHWCLRSRPYVRRSGARTSKRPIKSSS
jgi:hypothetical protein